MFMLFFIYRIYVLLQQVSSSSSWTITYYVAFFSIRPEINLFFFFFTVSWFVPICFSSASYFFISFLLKHNSTDDLWELVSIRTQVMESILPSVLNCCRHYGTLSCAWRFGRCLRCGGGIDCSIYCLCLALHRFFFRRWFMRCHLLIG